MDNYIVNTLGYYNKNAKEFVESTRVLNLRSSRISF